MNNSLIFSDGRLSIRKGFLLKDFDNINQLLKISEKIKVKKIMPSRIYIYCDKKRK
jgi:hypothetical protein